MIIVKKSIIIFLLLIISKAYGQQEIISIHYNQFEINEKKTSYKEHALHNNEVTQVASFFFLFYKEFVSSQDMNSCVFSPSCSVYAMESIRKLGFAAGLLNSFDRLTRCHGLGLSYYPVDPKTKRAYDPLTKD